MEVSANIATEISTNITADIASDFTAFHGQKIDIQPWICVEFKRRWALHKPCI